MIIFSSLQIRLGNHLLLDNSKASINPGQKVGLIGKNGSGKSTLLALIKGELIPEAGEVSIPNHWILSWVNQDTPSVKKPALQYVIDGDRPFRQLEADLQTANQKNKGETIAKLHGMLDEIEAWSIRARAASLMSGLVFAHNELEQPVHFFSGGWRMRLNLAQALMCRSNLLLLDEPTNHLDLEMRQALTEALIDFDGALVVVSHDRHFMRSTIELYLLDNGIVESFEGDMKEYEDWLLNAKRRPLSSECPSSAYPSAKEGKQRKNILSRQRQHLEKKIQALENKIEQLSEKLADIEARLFNPALYRIECKAELALCQREQNDLKNALLEAEKQWVDAQEILNKMNETIFQSEVKTDNPV